MKKVTALLLVILVCISIAACNNKEPVNTNTAAPGTPAATNSPVSAQPAPTVGIAAPIEVEQSETIVELVTYGLRNPSWDLSPWKGSGSSGNTMWLQLYSGLLANPSFGTALEDMQFDMAESVDLSADKLTATVKLRDYIHDSQGNAINAEDVVFCYKTAPSISGIWAFVETLLDSVSVIDEYTVEMKIKEYLPGTWERLLGSFPIVSKSWYEGASDEDKAINPAVTGAYRVVENIVGTSATFEALDNFWQKDDLRTIYQMVNARTTHFINIPEDAMRAIALENGEIDIGYLENINVPRFAGSPDYSVFQNYMTNPTTFILNGSENSVFYNNPALRKAVLHAIDWEQVLILGTEGYGFRAHDIAPAGCGDYDPAWDNAPYFDYDLDLARQYLADAGYENGGLTLNFLCRNVGTQKPTVVVVQSCLADIGINLVIDAFDQALFDTTLADPAGWDIVWHGASMSSGFVTESWEWYFGSRGDAGSFGFVKDDTLQNLLETAQRTNNAADKKAFRDYYMDQGYGTHAFTAQASQIARSYITNIHWNYMQNIALNTCVFTPGHTG